MNEYDILKSMKVQAEYCDQTGLPHSAPYTGFCFKCHHNIYEEIEQINPYNGKKYITGITVERAIEEIVKPFMEEHPEFA